VIGSDASTCLTDILHKNLIKKFFYFERTPKYFYIRTHHDVVTLNKLIDKPLVFIHCKSLENFKKQQTLTGVRKYYDSRLSFYFDRKNTEKPLIFLMTDDEKLYSLDSFFKYSCPVAESRFIAQGSPLRSYDCLIFKIQQFFPLHVVKKHECLGSYACVSDIVTFARNREYEVSEALGLDIPIALVSHVSSNAWSKRCKELFTTLGVLLNYSREKIVWGDVRYVSVVASRDWLYTLKDKQASEMLDTLDSSLKESKLTNEHERGEL